MNLNENRVDPVQHRCTGLVVILTRQQSRDEHGRVTQRSHRLPSLAIRPSRSTLMAETIVSAESGFTPAGNKSVPSGDSSVINGRSPSGSLSNSIRPGVTSTFTSTPGRIPSIRTIGAGSRSLPDSSKLSVAVMFQLCHAMATTTSLSFESQRFQQPSSPIRPQNLRQDLRQDPPAR